MERQQPVTDPLGPQDDKHQETVQVRVQQPSEPKFRRMWWGRTKPEDVDPVVYEEKRTRRSLVRRLDMFLLTCCCLSYTMKYIDQQAHTNAYVSGMKEDLGFKGNELNLINSLFSVGYAVGTFFSQALIAKYRPSIVIPCFEVIWSLLVMVNAAAQNVKLLCGMRFLIGTLESISYPGFISVLTAWYTPAELAKRVALLNASSAAGSMFSGYLAAGMLAGMQGKHGLAAWRWLFIFDGLLSLPIATLGFFLIPDSPHITRAKWLKQSHIDQAKQRMDEIGRAPRRRLTWSKVIAIFKEYPIYIMLLAYPTEIVSSQAISYFSLFLKAKPFGRHFTQYQINLIPTGGQALQIVATLIFATLSDKLRKRPLVICMQVSCGLLGFILLCAWDNVGFNGAFAGYMLIYCTVGSGAISLTWYSELCSADAEIRTMVVGIANGVGLAVIAGLPFVMYPNVEAPRYHVGYPLGVAFYTNTIVLTLLLAYLVKRFGQPYSKGITTSNAANPPDESGDRKGSQDDLERGGEKRQSIEPEDEKNLEPISTLGEVSTELVTDKHPVAHSPYVAR